MSDTPVKIEVIAGDKKRTEMFGMAVPKGSKPYIFRLRAVYGQYQEPISVLRFTDNPQEELHQIAREQRDLTLANFDESTGTYWFGDNTIVPMGFREISLTAAAILKAAEDFKY